MTLVHLEKPYMQTHRKSGGYKTPPEKSENGLKMWRFTTHSPAEDASFKIRSLSQVR